MATGSEYLGVIDDGTPWLEIRACIAGLHKFGELPVTDELRVHVGGVGVRRQREDVTPRFVAGSHVGLHRRGTPKEVRVGLQADKASPTCPFGVVNKRQDIQRAQGARHASVRIGQSVNCTLLASRVRQQVPPPTRPKEQSLGLARFALNIEQLGPYVNQIDPSGTGGYHYAKHTEDEA